VVIAGAVIFLENHRANNDRQPRSYRRGSNYFKNITINEEKVEISSSQTENNPV